MQWGLLGMMHIRKWIVGRTKLPS